MLINIPAYGGYTHTFKCGGHLDVNCGGNVGIFGFSFRRSNVSMGGSPGDVSEEQVTKEKRKKGWRMSCDVGEATEGLENEL